MVIGWKDDDLVKTENDEKVQQAKANATKASSRTSVPASTLSKKKKLRPKLNKQLVTKGVSYLLKVF